MIYFEKIKIHIIRNTATKDISAIQGYKIIRVTVKNI